MASPDGTPRDPLIGALLGGKFLVESPLARGGMGRVYRGLQKPLDRVVAIKVLDFHALDPERNELLEKRFFLEASVCAKLTHPNTLTVHDYGPLDGGQGVFIAMEFLEGHSLRDLIKRGGPLSVPRALHVGKQICGALIEAHEAGLVHRDLKPANVVLVRRGNDADFVKVVDFGLVKQLAPRDDSSEVLTTEGAFLGTPRYMAPEQVAGQPIDARTDIYALGVVLYECLIGRPPFRSKVQGQVPVDLLNAHLQTPPPPLKSHEAGAHVPDELEVVVMRCLEKRPELRYPSMCELLRALERVEQDARASSGSLSGPTARAPLRRPPPSTGPTRHRDGVVDAEPSETTQVTVDLRATGSAPWRARGWVGVGAGVCLATIVVGGVGFLLWSRTQSPPLLAAPAAQPAPAPPVTVRLTVRSQPAGAVVQRGEEELGVTPLEVELPRAALADAAARALTLRAEGHLPATRTFGLPADDAVTLEVELEPKPKPKPKPKSPKKRRPRGPSPKKAPRGGGLDIKVDR